MFRDIDELCGEYIRELESGRVKQQIPLNWDEQEWDRSVLHITDLGSCPRKVALRFLKAPTRYIPETVLALKARRFHMAHQMHCLWANVFDYHGILEHYEYPIPLPPGWSGRCDYIVKCDWFRDTTGEYCVMDCKTAHPNAFRYQYKFPYEGNVIQVADYTGFLEGHFPLYPRLSPPGLFYCDNGGGANRTIIKWVDDWYGRYKDSEASMKYFEGIRDSCLAIGEYEEDTPLPAILPKKAVFRSNNTLIKLEPDWRCNENYCEYSGGTACSPDMGTKTLAKKIPEDGSWAYAKVGKSKYRKEIDELLLDSE